MKDTEEVKIDILRKIFTDFNGDFDARLSHVASSSGVRTEKGMVIAGPTRFVCRIKVNYKKELMKKLREGMILAVRNFKAKNNERYTLMEISRFWPEHFGLKGVSDELYYPIQREIIEQSSKDWDTDDTSTMMIQLNAIPINYDLIVRGDELEFENGWTFPIIGEKVNILNRTSIAYLFNKEILKKLLKKEKITIKDFEEYERKLNKKKVNPRIGVIQMFTDEEIPLLVDFEDLIRYHFGVFAFTGGGKSNLVANLIRKAYHYEKDIKILIFDISCEYIILLLDLLCKEDSVKIVLDKEVKNVEELDKSVVKPKIFEKEELLKKIKEKLHELMKSNKIKVLKLEEKKTYGMIIDLLTKAKEDYIKRGKPQAFVVDNMLTYLNDFLKEKEKSEMSEISLEELETIVRAFEEILARSGLRYPPDDIPKALKSWMESLKKAKEKIEENEEKMNQITIDEIIGSLSSDEKEIIVLSIPDPVIIRRLAIRITEEMLNRRKRTFKIKPFILFVFDEAQEFIKALDKAKGEEKECSIRIENLSRHGRKYGLGVCISTQRIAHLNTNVLQQLHTYFIGTLPRPYDRALISDVCVIDKEILDKTLEFGKGEWIVSSYSATGIPNVPIFIKADNTEEAILEFLNSSD